MTTVSHLVQFYESEDSLVELAAAFLADGALAGELLIVIATALHRGGIAAALAAKAPGADRFIFFDADETLSSFMAGTTPIDDFMRREIELALTAGGASQQVPIRVYGELADLLIRYGNIETALAAEDFCSSFVKSRAISFLCAHGLENFYEDSTGCLLHEVCVRHERTNPGV